MLRMAQLISLKPHMGLGILDRNYVIAVMSSIWPGFITLLHFQKFSSNTNVLQGTYRKFNTFRLSIMKLTVKVVKIVKIISKILRVDHKSTVCIIPRWNNSRK